MTLHRFTLEVGVALHSTETWRIETLTCTKEGPELTKEMAEQAAKALLDKQYDDDLASFWIISFKGLPSEPDVIIEVRSGVAEVIKAPKDALVVIRDWDMFRLGECPDCGDRLVNGSYCNDCQREWNEDED